MRYKAVLFDFDFTLGDSTGPIVAAAQDALRVMGYPEPTAEAVHRTIGYRLQETYTLLTGDPSPEQQERFTQLFRDVSREIEETVLLPGAWELLTHLRGAGVQVAIVVGGIGDVCRGKRKPHGQQRGQRDVARPIQAVDVHFALPPFVPAVGPPCCVSSKVRRTLLPLAPYYALGAIR